MSNPSSTISGNPCGCAESHVECCHTSQGGFGHGSVDSMNHGFVRRFSTKTERIEKLKEYLSILKLEKQAVEECIGELQKK